MSPGRKRSSRARRKSPSRPSRKRSSRRGRRPNYRVRRLSAGLVLVAVVVIVVVLVTQHHHKPPPAIRTVNVTVLPGISRRQLQQRLHASGIPGNYVADTVSSPLIDPTKYGAPARVHSLEGFLWPDTYNLDEPVQISALIADQLKAFQVEFAKVDLSYAKSKDLTGYDVLKIASLVSEEAMLSRDLPRAASVIYNRLRDRMDLGLDSTVSYATGNYGELTEHDLQSSSPWNTTNHPGLPPTPIDSPDLAAIQAAAHPAVTDDLYFINKVCGNGALRFTASYDQFLRWSSAWDKATAKAAKDGGSAEFCKGKP